MPFHDPGSVVGLYADCCVCSAPTNRVAIPRHPSHPCLTIDGTLARRDAPIPAIRAMCSTGSSYLIFRLAEGGEIL